MNVLLEVKKYNWITRWAGSYTFLSCSYWGRQYYNDLKKVLGVGFANTLFIHKKGIVSFLLPQREFKAFGAKLTKKVVKDKKIAFQYLKKLKKNTDKLSSIFKQHKSEIPTWKEYEKFYKYFSYNLPLHNFMKKTTDFLPPDLLEQLLPSYTEARLYSEHIFSDTELYFRRIARSIGKKAKVDPDYLTCLTQDEFELYLRCGILPLKSILQRRYLSSTLYFKRGKEVIMTGDKNIKDIDAAVVKRKDGDKIIKGTSSFAGRVRGAARIILDPSKISRFNKGDILVTGMTRPEFLPFIRKAGAIITDAGGILSHAAITARELKIPCIVGTDNATKVLHNDDLVEVDANKGIVKIL